MNQTPLVSIIIPVYNGSNFMREAIDSALAQTYPNIEILVVNDGSTDDTREIALSYGDKIRYFEKENGGVATALNLAIREMKGRYFSWLSHDDWYTPDKVAVEIEALRRCGDMDRAVFSECDFVKYPGKTVKKTNYCRFGQSLTETGWFAVLMGLISGCTLLIPRSYFTQYGGFDESVRAVNDYEQWFRMFRDKRLVYVGRSLVGSRVHERQVTVTYEGMSEEQDRMYAWMMKDMAGIDVSAVGLSLYQIYSMYLPFCLQGYEHTRRYIVPWFQQAEEPAGAADACRKLSERLHDTPGGVYVYCAGRVAKRFLASLRWRGITVNGVSDSQPSRWGTALESVRCIPPKDIPKDARIIIANAYDAAVIAEQLGKQGFLYVESYEDWQKELLMTPIQKDCCEVLS